MAFLRPSADDVDGLWLNESGNNTNLYASLDETTAGDTDYIVSPDSPVLAVCRIALSDPAGALAEPFVLRYRFNNVSGTTLKVRLVQGASAEIASWTESGSGWTTQARTLTSPQFALITDFNDLFVEFTADFYVDPLRLDLDFTAGTLDSKITFTRTTTAAYVNSSGLIASAAIDAPRFDYNPSTLAARGLLIEEQRKNIFLQSQNFADGTWLVYDASKIGVAGVADPAGGSNAYEVAFGTTGGAVTGAAALYQNFAGGDYNVSQPHTATFYVRAKTGTSSIRVGFFLGTANTGSADIPITSSAWTRISYTDTAGGTVGGGNLSLRNNAAGNTGSIYVACAQAEQGDAATSYIPTTSAAVTRAADSALMTGTNFSSWYNAAAGTFVAGFDGPASGTRPIIAADDNTANEVIMLYGSGTDPKAIVTDGGATQADLDAGTIVAGTAAKLGLSFAANDFAACLNGGTVATDTGGTLPAVTQARLGLGPAGNYLNGHIASLKFYNIAKTDAELIALTT